ncbi:MAG TPA: PAS domain-containing protein, partial [Puia sp.]
MTDLQTSIRLISEICEEQPEAAVWVKPVWSTDGYPDGRKIVDFQFHYCNPAILDLLGKPAEQIIGKCVLDDRLPDPAVYQIIFDQCREVYETGRSIQYSYLSKGLGKYISLQRVRAHDGVLTTARNRTGEFKLLEEREGQARLLENLVEHSPYGISLYESMRDGKGEITDFKLKLCNRKSSEITGLSLEELFGKTVKELMQLRGHSVYFDICKRVVEKGDPHYMEYYSTSRDQWLGFSFVKFGDGYLLNYIEITQTKKYEQEAKRNAQELSAIFNGSLNGIFSAKLVRDPEGQIFDLIFLRANESFYRMFPETSGQLIGQSLLAISEKEDQSLFLKYVDEVISSGKPAIHVLHYDNSGRWFELSMAKLEEEIISVTLNDITAQKLALLEIERQKNLLAGIMKQSPSGLAVMKAIRDQDGKIKDAVPILLNEACERLLGVPNEILLAGTIGRLEPSLPESSIFDAAGRLAAGESIRTEYYQATTCRWLELAIGKMDEDHFINVLTDITEIKETQQQLEASVADLKRSNENLEDFAYAASHDLKEPIRKIRYYAEQLK